MRPLFTHKPSAWLITPRHGQTPAEYAACVEVYRKWSLWQGLVNLVRRMK